MPRRQWSSTLRSSTAARSSVSHATARPVPVPRALLWSAPSSSRDSNCLERWPALQIQRGHLTGDQLRDAAGSRLLLGPTRQRRTNLQCGWLKDKFGLSWQVVPSMLSQLLQDKDLRKSQRVMEAVLQMVKLEIPRLKAAYEGHERRG